MKEKLIYLLDYGVSKEIIFKLGWELRKEKFILIPVKPNDLKSLLTRNQTRLPVVSLVQSKFQFEQDLVFKKKFLYQAISNLKLKYLEFTSFSEVQNKYLSTNRKKINQFLLPLEFSNMAAIINQECSSYYQINNKWPGGIRAKLPI